MAANQERVLETYRYLRILMLLPAVWLLLAILVVAVFRDVSYDSISDYYGGPLRDVFVGALMASGICMIAYKGQSKLEDYALNFAGFNAFFVALVPNSFPRLLDEARTAESSADPPPVSSGELLANLKIAGWTLLVVALIFVLVDWGLMRWTRFRLGDQTTAANVLIGVSWVAELLLIGVLLAMLLGRETLLTWSIFSVLHFGAAVLLIVNLSFAAASHGLPQQLRTAGDATPPSPQAQWVFRLIMILMWVGGIAGFASILAGVPSSIFWTEVVEIVLFLVFWMAATRHEWHRSQPAPGADPAPVAVPA